jgi:AsmA-like C-terminal region
MKVLPKILKIAVIIFVAVLVLLFSASLIMQNRVVDIIIKTLNRNFTTKIETGSYRLSLIRKFPNATVELKNVLVHSSPTFDVSAFKDINTDTLLAAKSASIICRMTDLLRGAYTFTRIDVKSGNLNIFTDSSGGYNYEFSGNESGSTSNKVRLNLNRINLSDVKFVYNDLRVNLVIKGVFRDGRCKSKIKGNNIDFEGNSGTLFTLFSIDSTEIKQRIPAKLDVRLSKNQKGIFFRKSTMTVENWDFILTGFVASDNYLDLNVTGNNIDISRIVNLFPEKYRDKVSDFHPSGILKLDSKIKGYASKKENPHCDVSFSLKNARINNRRSDIKIDRFSFDGSLTNGTKNDFETSLFRISNFTARLGSSEFRGSFSMMNFSKPKAELTLKGALLPEEITEFFNLRNVAEATGSIDLDLNFSGYPDTRNGFRVAELLDMNSHSTLGFKSLGIKLNNKNIDFRDVNGDVFIKENTVTDNFRFNFNGQKIRLTGKFVNFPGWLAGNPVTLSGSGVLYASLIKPELFMDSSTDKNKAEKVRPPEAPLTLPSDINIDLDFSLDTLIYKTFNARKISGSLGIRPKMLNFRTINLNSQKGKVSGNILVAQHPDKSFTGRGTFDITGVDVNEAFTTFHNFGQGFLKAENIAGSLSGTISLVLPVDSLLKPLMSKLTAEGKYILTDGALIDFDPVKALSSFIALSELENIKFSQLENTFFIKDNVFYVPQIDVNSSAVDLSVNGKHSFENEYEYHVKMRLSEILSNKARKNKTLSDEFGEIEDDGLGRTSILLRINGKGEDVKVSYDMKAAGNQIKSEFQKEKQNLRTILNEEYGGYSKSPEKEKTQASKPRFRVSWEGSDTINPAREEVPAVKKESVIKRIFRKK